MNDLDINFAPVFNGKLSVGHRPKLKRLKHYKEAGVTVVLTLLSEKEGAQDIGKACGLQNLDWLWLSLENGKPPDEEKIPEIEITFKKLLSLLKSGENIFIHCSAGIHRTGMMAYAFLRFCGESKNTALSVLKEMRAITGQEVGEDRVQWGDDIFGK